MHKVVLKHIDEIANLLPQVKYNAAVERQKITGVDVRLSGAKEIEGERVDPNKNYLINVPVIREVDHKQRMKRAYKRSGKVGVIHYLRPYVEPDKFGPLQVHIMRSMP